MVFSSVTQPPKEFLATFENPATDDLEFDNVPSALPYWASFTAANHTPSGIKVVRMNQDFNIGPAKSLKVYPGDKVDMEVWTYYENSSGFGTSSPVLNTLITAVAGAFGGVSGGSGEQGAIYNGVDGALNAFGTGGNRGDAAPGAYLNYILFDKDYNVLDMGWTPATGYNAQQKISIDDIAVTEPGYIFVYLSYENESGNFVQFDDFKVTHTMTNVIQYNEYYPFGLQTSNSWTRENSSNNFLYNAGTELNSTSGVYETMFRGYDPALGRFLQVDPLASMYASHTPYKYGLNNPVNFNDPSGANEISINNYVDIDNIASGGGAMLRSGYNRKPRWNETHEDADRYRRGEMSLDEYVNKYSVATAEVNPIFGYDARNFIFDFSTQRHTPLLKKLLGYEIMFSRRMDSGDITTKHGDGYDLIIESFTELTPIGERDILNSAILLYDKHGNTTDILLEQKVQDWNQLGWYKGPNPQTNRADLALEDLSIRMLEAIIRASDYHCEGCLLGPVLVPIESTPWWSMIKRKKGNLNVTSSGSSSYNKKQPWNGN